MEPRQNRIIQIPERFNVAQRQRIGEDIVRFIRQRTQNGLDINGNFFAPYSKDYEKSGQSVDLRFSGNMMGDLEVLSHGIGFITIGFLDTESNDKAAWIQSPGGQKSGSAIRKFVGISQEDLNVILDRYDN
jgi:hypothetical protein